MGYDDWVPKSAAEVYEMLLSLTSKDGLVEEGPVITQVDPSPANENIINNNDDDNADQYKFAEDMFNNNPIEDTEFVEVEEQSAEPNNNIVSRRQKRRGKQAVEPDPEDSPRGDDEDWTESEFEEETEDDSEDSDVPSDALEDIEESCDDDIFKPRDRSRAARREKIKKMKQARRRKRKGDENNVENNVEEAEWYSDPGEDERFDEAPLSDEDAPRYPHWKEGDNVKKLKLTVGYTFDTVAVYKKVLIDWSILNGYELDFVKSESRRVTACCMAENCDWRIHASCIQNSKLFQVKTITGKHSCAKKGRNFRAGSSYLGEKMEQTIRDNPDVPVRKFKRIIQRKVGVQVSYFIALRAKRKATEKIKGEFDKEFELLWNYGATVLANNPGSKIIIKKEEDSDPPIFERMYFSLRAMTEGFMAGCRPIIGLDGCFIKNMYGGQLLSAIGKDGNDNLFPIAIAYVRTENYENWLWFLEELLLDIGGLGEDRWTFITDRQKGLLDAVSKVCPESEHRFCLRHMYQNFYKKWKSVDMKNLFWRAASAGNKEEWAAIMKNIQLLDPKVNPRVQTAYEWLMEINPCHWARSHFRSTCKTDVLVNNICESFNNMILPCRDLPVISMFEWIRGRLIERHQIKRTGMNNYHGNICPAIMDKINKQSELTKNCIPIWCGDLEFQVDEKDDQFVVKLDKRTCTCGMFQLNGYPCRHAYVCITERRMEIEDFVDPCYTKETYLKVYAYMMYGVPGKKHFIQTDYTPLGPPKCTKKRGRPYFLQATSQKRVVSSAAASSSRAFPPPTAATREQVQPAKRNFRVRRPTKRSTEKRNTQS